MPMKNIIRGVSLITLSVLLFGCVIATDTSPGYYYNPDYYHSSYYDYTYPPYYYYPGSYYTDYYYPSYSFGFYF